jgi:hypothetical protein
MAFLTHFKAKLCQNFYPNIGFWENANFLAENWQNSQKIVIITSTPGLISFVEQQNVNWINEKNVKFMWTHMMTTLRGVRCPSQVLGDSQVVLVREG